MTCETRVLGEYCTLPRQMFRKHHQHTIKPVSYDSSTLIIVNSPSYGILIVGLLK